MVSFDFVECLCEKTKLLYFGMNYWNYKGLPNPKKLVDEKLKAEGIDVEVSVSKSRLEKMVKKVKDDVYSRKIVEEAISGGKIDMALRFVKEKDYALFDCDKLGGRMSEYESEMSLREMMRESHLWCGKCGGTIMFVSQTFFSRRGGGSFYFGFGAYKGLEPWNHMLRRYASISRVALQSKMIPLVWFNYYPDFKGRAKDFTPHGFFVDFCKFMPKKVTGLRVVQKYAHCDVGRDVFMEWVFRFAVSKGVRCGPTKPLMYRSGLGNVLIVPNEFVRFRWMKMFVHAIDFWGGKKVEEKEMDGNGKWRDFFTLMRRTTARVKAESDKEYDAMRLKLEEMRSNYGALEGKEWFDETKEYLIAESRMHLEGVKKCEKIMGLVMAGEKRWREEGGEGVKKKAKKS